MGQNALEERLSSVRAILSASMASRQQQDDFFLRIWLRTARCSHEDRKGRQLGQPSLPNLSVCLHPVPQALSN
jgi:hypothetical protein